MFFETRGRIADEARRSGGGFVRTREESPPPGSYSNLNLGKRISFILFFLSRSKIPFSHDNGSGNGIRRPLEKLRPRREVLEYKIPGTTPSFFPFFVLGVLERIMS